jgi:hypothetical protein
MKIKLWQFEIEIENNILWFILTALLALLFFWLVVQAVAWNANTKLKCMEIHSYVECKNL